METQSFDLGAQPKVRLENVGGTLRLTAHEEPEVLVRCRDHDQAQLKSDEKKGELNLLCPSDCHIAVPPKASIEGERVGGDLTITGIQGGIAVRSVGGDVIGRRIGQLSIEQIGGSASVRKMTGNLSVDNMGGDCRAEDVEGDVRLRGIGGDARLSRVEGEIDVNAGGDVRLAFTPAGKQESKVSAGGDVDCLLGEESSVEINLSAGGDIRLAVPADLESDSQIKLGDREARLQLSSGGDLNLRMGQDERDYDLGEAIAARIGAELQAEMADLEVHLRDLGARVESNFDSERIAKKMQRAVDKAQRKAEKARLRAVRKLNQLGDRQVDLRFGAGRGRGSMEQERLMILRMIEQGKITVEEAETLLQALED